MKHSVDTEHSTDTVKTGGCLQRLHNALQAVTVALFAMYFALVLLQVFYRYVLNRPIFWAEEIVRSTLVWGVLLGSALVAHRRGHIRVELVEQALPPKGRRLVVTIADALSFTFCALLVWTGIQLIDRTWMQSLSVLDVPRWVVYLAIPTGAALECLFTFFAWKRGLRRPRQRDAAL